MTIKDRNRLKDHYSEKAKKEGYPARSVFKLGELDAKHRILGPGMRVLDLGAAPGSWSLYASGKTGPKGLVVALDLKKLTVRSPNIRAFEADILKTDPSLREDGGPFDAVLSDLAPSTTGIGSVDSERSLELNKAALKWAERLLRPGGSFLFKMFQGGSSDAHVKERVKPLFRDVILLKPKATRKGSAEIFVLGKGFLKRKEG
ncbi:MAG: RlmE family RNA methyltransferase [Deltaproteobacteria bacterium]|nr:RlmE family RNA methyltransferase [Deltaproteobacteria bacterium]